MPTDLTAALIARQDAMARRAAAKIRAILDTHVPAAQAARDWMREAERAGARLLAVPDTWARQCPDVPPAAVAAARTFIADALEHCLQLTDADRQLAAEPVPVETRPLVRRSTTLTAARAQNAQLGAALIDLRQRLVTPGTWTLGGHPL